MLGRYPAQDMPALVQQLQQIHSRASLLGIRSAGSATRGGPSVQADMPSQGVQREASLEAWAQNGATAPAEAPAEFSPTEWTPDDPAAFRPQEWHPEDAADSARQGQPETPADFAPQEWQPESPEAFSPGQWTPEQAEDFSPAEWAPEHAAGSSPIEWTPEAPSDSAAAEWQLQEGQPPSWSQQADEGSAAQGWQSDGSATGFSPADFEAPAAFVTQLGYRTAGWTPDTQGDGISPEEWADGSEAQALGPAEWSAADSATESQPAADPSGWEHPQGSAQPDQSAAQQGVSSGHPAGQTYRAAQGLLPPGSAVSSLPEDGQGRPQPQQQQARQSVLLGDGQQLLRGQGQNSTAGREHTAPAEPCRSAMPAAGLRPDYDQRALPQPPPVKVRHPRALFSYGLMSIAAFRQIWQPIGCTLLSGKEICRLPCFSSPCCKHA